MSDAWFSSRAARASKSRNGSNRVTISVTSGSRGTSRCVPVPSRQRGGGDGHACLRDAHVLALSPLQCQEEIRRCLGRAQGGPVDDDLVPPGTPDDVRARAALPVRAPVTDPTLGI